MGLLNKLKNYAIYALLAIASIFFVRGKALEAQRDRYRRKAKEAAAERDQVVRNDAADTEIEREYSDLQREAEREIKNRQMPDSLRNRNRV